MIIISLIPLSYIIGIIISKITFEEILTKKKWFKNWYYLCAIIPLSIALNTEAYIFILCLINYIKSGNDLLTKKSIASIILDNIIFLILGALSLYL